MQELKRTVGRRFLTLKTPATFFLFSEPFELRQFGSFLISNVLSELQWALLNTSELIEPPLKKMFLLADLFLVSPCEPFELLGLIFWLNCNNCELLLYASGASGKCVRIGCLALDSLLFFLPIPFHWGSSLPVICFLSRYST